MDFDELDPGLPPEVVDAEIARLEKYLDDGDAETLLKLASLCWIRFVQSMTIPGRWSSPDDLDRSVDAFGRAMSTLRGDDRVDPLMLAGVLLTFADVLHARHSMAGDPADLDRAIDLSREAIPLVGEPLPPSALGSMSDRYVDRYCIRGHDADLTAAERALRAALSAYGTDPTERASLWLRLGHLYDTRATADPSYRDKAIETLGAGWREGAGYPLLGMAYVDELIVRGRETKGTELSTALAVLAAIDVEDLPVDMQANYHHYEMEAYFQRHVPGEVADLLAAGRAATRFIDHPYADDDMRAQARGIRATTCLDHLFITGDTAGAIDGAIADLKAAADRVNPGMRQTVDTQLVRALSEQARRTSDPGDIGAAIGYAEAALRRLPEGTSMRAEVGYHLGFLLMMQVETGRAGSDSLDAAVDLFRAVVTQEVAVPSVSAVAAAQLAGALIGRLYYVGRGDAADFDIAIGHLRKALEICPAGNTNRFAIAVSLASTLMTRFELRGDLADLHWCRELLRDVRGEAPNDPNRHELALNLAQVELAYGVATGETPDAQLLHTLADALAGIAPGNVTRIQVLRALASGYAVRAQATGDEADATEAVRFAEAVLSDVPANSPLAALMRMSAGGVLVSVGRIRDDGALVGRGIDVIAGLVDDEALPQRERYLGMFGSGLLDLYRRNPDPELLDRAIRTLAEANALAATQPGTRGTAEIAMALFGAVAVTGDRARIAEAGRAALHAYTWQVLLQSGTHEAMTVAARSATDALGVARVLLRAGDPRGACLALETGRGLVLHAATVAASVPDLLRRAGQPELAREWTAALHGARPSSDWRSAVPAAPDDLRFRVLRVLREETALFDPPSIDTLRGALSGVVADCLVYLFPGADDDPGLALIVAADGWVESIDLPGLTGKWSVPSEVQQAARGLSPMARALTRDWPQPVTDPTSVGRSLADACAEAWDVAIGPILDRWHSRNRSAPSMVLVLGGSLATVPWHAAHSRTGDRRWAIDEAEISYIASGRLLVDLAGRTVAPLDRTGLIIGNPLTRDAGADLPGAGGEACTIFSRYYAKGRYCGQAVSSDIPVSGRGTPHEVLGWFDGAGPVLHLACHGIISADGPASSRLLVADGATVSAEEILRSVAARPNRRSGGIVTLAACTTHRAGRAYDEAVTLSTAFLVAGATTAIGSLWQVPDDGTAQLMVAFHDHLAGRGLPPRAALRAAQRAMRDAGGDARLAEWAGFVHLGH